MYQKYFGEKMLYLIGLGLWDEKDISMRGLEAIKNCEKVYIELYTSKWTGKGKLENIIGKKIEELVREKVESDFLVKEAKENNIALLVPGDPLVATTHSELIIEAKKQGIDVKTIHSSSIYTAIGETGLQLYKFGKATTIPFPQKSYEPTSPYDVIEQNLKNGLHTLIFLDVKREESKYMAPTEAAKLLLEMEKKKNKGIITPDKKIVVCSAMGSDEQEIKYLAIEKINSDKTPGVLILPADLHFKEKEALEMFE